MEEVSIIGVDLAKNVFQLHGAAADNPGDATDCGPGGIAHVFAEGDGG